MSKVQFQATLVLMLAATLSATTLQVVVAQPPFPSGFPFGVPVDVQRCWSSVLGVEGCAEALFDAVSSGQFGPLGPACCKAVLAVDDNCWHDMFSGNSFFPDALKGFCGSDGAVPPSAML